MSLKVTQELKGLNTQLTKLLAEMNILNDEKEIIVNKYKAASDRVKLIKQKIKSLEDKNKDVSITEHALLRYFERAMGFDLEELRQKILTDEFKAMVGSLGENGTYPLNGSSVRAKVVDKTIVTILN